MVDSPEEGENGAVKDMNISYLLELVRLVGLIAGFVRN